MLSTATMIFIIEKLFCDNIWITFFESSDGFNFYPFSSPKYSLCFLYPRTNNDILSSTKPAILAGSTGVARNFDWEGPKLENILWRYFGDVFGDVLVMTSPKWCHNFCIFLKFDFVVISFKNHCLAKSRNSRSSILKVKRRWGRKDLSAWRFLKI